MVGWPPPTATRTPPRASISPRGHASWRSSRTPSRHGWPARRVERIGKVLGPYVAERGFEVVAERLGADPRQTEPGRVLPLVEDVPLLVIHGGRDPLIPARDVRRLASILPTGRGHLVIDGGDHSGAHTADPVRYETEVTSLLRTTFGATREGPMAEPILSAESLGDAGATPPLANGQRS